jgi:hypothetical protein
MKTCLKWVRGNREMMNKINKLHNALQNLTVPFSSSFLAICY